MTHLDTGLVPRFPALIISVAFAIVAALMMSYGMILDTTIRTQLEMRRLIFERETTRPAVIAAHCSAIGTFCKNTFLWTTSVKSWRSIECVGPVAIANSNVSLPTPGTTSLAPPLGAAS
jgi:hypothetical protein